MKKLEVILIFLALTINIAKAQFGTLDQTFGTFGFSLASFGTTINWQEGNAMALLPDGRILLAGDLTLSNGVDFGLMRFKKNGGIDSTFGTNGRVITHFSTYTSLKSIACQPDGKIIVCGRFGTNNPISILVARYDSSGVLDASFGTAGVLIITIPGVPILSADALFLQPDGKILVGGLADDSLFLMRLDPVGAFDNTFGNNGIVLGDFGGMWNCNDIRALGNGKIVIAGAAYAGYGRDFGVAQFLPNGAIDNSFGTNGVTVARMTATPNTEEAFALAIQTNGKIVVGGYTDDPNILGGVSEAMLVMRFDAQGNLDPSFGSNGKALAKWGVGSDNELLDLAIQPDGKIVGVGYSHYSWWNIALARFNTNGTLDNTFGTAGQLTTDIGNYDRGRAVLIQQDGNILVGGQAANTAYFAVLRYISGLNVGIIDNMLNENHITVYPNPIIDQFRIQYFLQRSQNIDVSIYTFDGKLIKSFLYANKESGDHEELIEFDSKIPSGNYIIYICGENGSKAIQIAKQ